MLTKGSRYKSLMTILGNVFGSDCFWSIKSSMQFMNLFLNSFREDYMFIFKHKIMKMKTSNSACLSPCLFLSIQIWQKITFVWFKREVVRPAAVEINWMKLCGMSSPIERNLGPLYIMLAAEDLSLIQLVKTQGTTKKATLINGDFTPIRLTCNYVIRPSHFV